ncbi:MAG: FadR/GntR family transcriptional regulator [Micromonosporaceae bacterium]
MYEQLVELLCEHIEEAGLRPGDRLPPERELAAQLGVSRVSVSQALVALEVQGIIDVRHGDGAVLLETRPEQQVISALRARQRRLPEIIEAREALEVKLADLAAQRRTDDDLRRIDEALAFMESEIQEGGRGEVGDERFHATVTAAAHSNLLADLMKELSPLILETRIESLAQPDRPQQSLAGHRSIAEAIRAQDPQRAAQAMLEHIQLVSDVAVLRWDEVRASNR